MIKKYEQYLDLITRNLLNKYFEQQKEFIHCKEGCSICCESGQYPYSSLEFEYAILGYNELADEQKKIVDKKVKKIFEEKSHNKDADFFHECPFLIDKKCTIYNHRGIICRTHGLLYFITNNEGKQERKMPNCVNHGLNYSEIYDESTKMLSTELWEKAGYKAKPAGYNLGLKHLLNNVLTQELELEFGEVKAILDWFELKDSKKA